MAERSGGARPFDLRPLGYTPDEARAFLAAIGADGRAFYGDVQHWLDLFYPGLLALTLVFAFRTLARPLLAAALSVLAVGGAVCDWLENTAVAAMLAADPAAMPDELAVRAAAWTLAKSALQTAAFLALLSLIVHRLFRWLKSRRR